MLKQKVLMGALAAMLALSVSVSAQVVVNDTQTWGTGAGEIDTWLDTDRLVINHLPGRTLEIGSDGDLTINVRTDMVTDDGWNEDISIIINGGTLTTNGNGAFKLPGRLPLAGTTALARVFLNAGAWNARDIESAYNPWRRGQVVIKDGVLWLEYQGPSGTSENYEVRNMLARGSLVAAEGYELVFEDWAGNTKDPDTYFFWTDSMKISAVPKPGSMALLAVADSYVHANAPTENFGGEDLLRTGRSDHGTYPNAKIYMRFDASDLGEEILGVKSFNIFFDQTASVGRTQSIYVITNQADGSDVAWDEYSIKWNDAPANDFDGQGFLTGGGKEVTALGLFSSAGGQGWKTKEFFNSSGAETALLEALNSGDRKVTIGMRWAASQTDSRPWRSREFGNGFSAPYLEIRTKTTQYINNLKPENGAFVSRADNPQLEWSQDGSVAGLNVTYDVLFGTDPGAMVTLCPAVSGDGPFSCDPGTLDPDTVYWWQVIATDPNVPLVPVVYEGPVQSFLTDTAAVVIEVGGDPVSQTVAAGTENVQFSVSAIYGATYEWYKDGNILTGGANYSGETTDTLTILNVQLADEGFYHCVVSNALPSSALSASAQLLTERLVGWWKLDGDLTDSVQDVVMDAPKHDGARLGVGTPSFVTDVFEGTEYTVLNLTGDPNDVITMDGSTEFYNFHPRGITLSAWVKVSPGVLGDGARAGFVGKTAASPLRGYGLAHNDSGDALFTMRGSSFANLNSGTDVCNGQWRLVTGTYDAATKVARVYVNGALANEVVNTASNEALQITDTPLTLGFEGLAVPRYLNGYLADVRIHSYPLTIEEILTYYHGIVGGSTCLNPPEYDLTGDCRVNLADFALLASQWLDCNRYPTDACDL